MQGTQKFANIGEKEEYECTFGKPVLEIKVVDWGANSVDKTVCVRAKQWNLHNMTFSYKL